MEVESAEDDAFASSVEENPETEQTEKVGQLFEAVSTTNSEEVDESIHQGQARLRTGAGEALGPKPSISKGEHTSKSPRKTPENDSSTKL